MELHRVEVVTVMLPTVLPHVIFGVDTALALQGMCSSNWEWFPQVIVEGTGLVKGVISYLGVDEMPTPDELTSARGFTCTTIERSLIDLLRYNPHSEFIPEALIDYVGDKEALLVYAEKYGVRDKLEYEYEHLDEAYDFG